MRPGAARGTRACRRCPRPPPGGRHRRGRSGRGGSAAPPATTSGTRPTTSSTMARSARSSRTRNGGASTRRTRPSTTSVNFFAAPTFDRFLARLWSLGRRCPPAPRATTTRSRSSAVICAYQMSRNRASRVPARCRPDTHRGRRAPPGRPPCRRSALGREPAPAGWRPSASRPTRTGREASRRSHGGRTRAAVPASPTTRS